MNSSVLVANIKARKSEATVKTESKTITIDHRKQFVPVKETVNFPLEIEKVVRKNLQNKLFSLPIVTVTGLASVLVAEPTLAQEVMGAAQATADPLMSGELVKFFIKSALWMDVVALGVSIASSPVIGFVSIFNANTAKEWTHNLLKGMGITLFLQMLLIGLIYLGHLLFGENPYYIDPWAILAPCIKPAILEVVRSFKS
jgi:hypothetical protein